MDKRNNKRQSISQRLSLFMAAMMLVMALVVSVISFVALEGTYLRLYNEKAQDVVRTLAAKVDGDRIAGYVETGEKDDYYAWMKGEFDLVKSEFTGIQYLYLFQPREDHFIYVVEGNKAEDDPELRSELGETFDYRETEYTYLVPDVAAGRASTALIQGADAGYGKTISAWAPVFDSRGNVAGMVEADCTLSNIAEVSGTFVLAIIGFLALCIVLVLLLALWMLRRNVTVPLGKLTKMVDSYEHGTFNEARFRHNDEIQWLATSFTEMTTRISAYTEQVARATADKEHIRAEFDVAKQIQNGILPTAFPAFPERKEFDLIASVDASRDIGGDFYDFFLIDEDHLALVIGDGSDKGVPAALFMVIVKTLIKNRAIQGFSPAEVLQNVSEQLLESYSAGMFSTVWFAVLELSTGQGIAVNAGHEHPVLCRAGQRFALQEYRHSPPLGAIEGGRFRDHGFRLEPGDTLFVYTDGLTDTVNGQEELFGAGRIVEALNREPEASPSVLLQTVENAAKRFAGDMPQSDGITMLALRYFGPEGERDGF